MAKKTKTKITTDHMIRALDPRDADTKYMGDEPAFIEQPDPEQRNVALARAFGWYTWFYGRKDAKNMMVQYLELSERITDAKIVKRAADSDMYSTYCWLARMKLRGLILVESEESRLEADIARIIDVVESPQAKSTSALTIEVEEKPESSRPNIQELMRERARETNGELEGLLDDFIAAKFITKGLTRPIDKLAEKNVMATHVSILTNHWTKKLNEFETVYSGKDKELTQGYSNFNKTDLKAIIKYIETILADINGYANVKKAAKAPRAKKPVPVEKIVKGIKFLKRYEDPLSKLILESISPTKLHGASECYLYDTTKRKLIYLVADEYSKSFTVKGSSIIGFDQTKSMSKTLRKPAIQLKEFMKLGRPAGRKFFTEINTVDTTPSGRTSDGMIILKVF